MSYMQVIWKYKCMHYIMTASATNIISSYPEGLRGIAIEVSVCLSVCLPAITKPNFTKFSVCVTCVGCLVILWKRRDTLCTSGFVDVIMFSHNGLMARSERIVV